MALRIVLAATGVLTLLTAAVLISFWRMSNGVRMHVTSIQLDASQARTRVLLGADATLEGMDVAAHGLAVTGGNCDVFAGEGGRERILRSHLISATPSGIREVQFMFEIEHSSHTEILGALERGSVMSLTCHADLIVDMYRTGFTFNHAYDTENLIGPGDGALATPSAPGEQSSRVRLTSGPINVSWPTLASPNLAVGAEHRVEATVDASPGLVHFLKHVPVHVKADISYADVELQAVQVNASVDSTLQVKVEGQEPDTTLALSLPIHSLVSANSRLATALVSGLHSSPLKGTTGKPPRSLLFKASSPTSPLASAFGAEHTLGFQRDPEMPSNQDMYTTLWGRGRALLENGKSEDLAIVLNQLLTVDNDTIARVDVNVTRDQLSETSVDLSFVFRRLEEGWLSSRLDGHQDQRANATAVNLLLQFNEEKETAAMTSDLQILQNWSGGRPQVQRGLNASNDTLAVALALNTSKQFLEVSVGWTEHGAVHAGPSGNASSISTSAYSFTSTVDLDGDDGHGGYCRVRFEGPALRMSFDWTKSEPSAKVEEHALSLKAVRSPGKSVYLGELSTPSPAPAPPSARRLFGFGGFGGSWYHATSYHGVDMTCGAASANRWVAQENGFGAAIKAGMQPGGSSSCFPAGSLSMKLSCNATSGATLLGIYLDPFCFMQLMPPSGAAQCTWDTQSREYALDYCVAGREDLPSEATLYMQDGRVVKPGMNATQDGYVPPPQKGFADTLTMEAGMSTVLKVTVDRTLQDAVVVSGELQEENTCGVKEDSRYEAAASARWLVPGFTADDPQCRTCSMGDRGLIEWTNGAGQREVYDYCIPARFTASCCTASTWEETLNPTLSGLDMQMSAATPILGSTSWDRTKRLRMSGNWSTVGGLETGELVMAEDAQNVPFGMSIRWESKAQGGKSFSGELRDGGLTVLSASFTTIDEQDRIGLNFNLTSSSEGLGSASNATIVAGSALWDTAEQRHGADGFLASASASVVSSGELDFHAAGAAHYVSQALSTGVQLSAAISTPEPLLGLEAAMTYTDSDGRSVLGAFAKVNGSNGEQASHIQVQTASDASAVICAGTASDDRGRLVRVSGALAKSAQGGDLTAELQEEGAVTATAQGRLQKRESFYAGEVDLRVHNKPDTFRLAVNASDGFLPALASKRGYEEFYAKVSGATDAFQGFLVVRAEADLNSSDIAGFGWDVQLSELLADGARLDRLDGATFWKVPHSRHVHSPPLTTTTPLPMQGAATLLVLKMPIGDFEVLGAVGLAQRIAAVVGAAAEVIASDYVVDFAYAVSTTVTKTQVEEALAVLTGLHKSAFVIGVAPTSSTRHLTSGSRITAAITTQDRVVANSVLLSASNVAAIEASHTLQGAAGAASVVHTPTVAARVSIRVAASQQSATDVAAFRQQVQVAMGSAHAVSVIPLNATGDVENRVSHATTGKLSTVASVVSFLSLATLTMPVCL